MLGKIPTVSISDSRTNLVELAAMVYWLSIETLKMLKEQEPELFSSGTGRRFMSYSEVQERSPLGVPKVSLTVMEFGRINAIASLDERKPVIPVWLDLIDQELAKRLG